MYYSLKHRDLLFVNHPPPRTRKWKIEKQQKTDRLDSSTDDKISINIDENKAVKNRIARSEVKAPENNVKVVKKVIRKKENYASSE